MTAHLYQNEQHQPLNTMFGFLGLTDVQYVYAEGMGMGPEAVARAQAQADAEINAILV